MSEEQGEFPLDLTRHKTGISLDVQVIPRAPREEVAGIRNRALLIRITAPPVEGKANQALIRCLARRFHLPPGAIKVIRGSHGRRKAVFLEGITPREFMERLDLTTDKSGAGPPPQNESRKADAQ